jgi:hypothetical protein
MLTSISRTVLGILLTPKASITALSDSVVIAMNVLSVPSMSRIHSIQAEDPRRSYLWLQQMMRSSGANVIVLTRLSPQRLEQLIHLEDIEHRWLTDKEDPASLEPTLERLHQFIVDCFGSGGGHIWLDAVEYLINMHGFDATLNFIRSLADAVAGSEWTVLLPFTPSAFDSTQIAQIRREAPVFETTTSSPDAVGIEDESPEAATEPVAADAQETEIEGIVAPGVEVEPGLVMLSRIPEASLSRAVLQRRMEQWKAMDFDVSDLLAALVMEREERYTRYVEYEEKVRRAVECERRIRELEDLGFMTEVTKLRFRLMQLTGLDDIEAILTRLLAEAR